MKKLAILFALAAIVFNSCSTDFDVTADYEETLVVYGLMDASKDTQYIRISRGYISEDRSALEIAQEADSIYFLANQLNVYIERVSDGAKLQFLEDRSLVKDSGIFARSPHLIYVLVDSLDEDETYRLRVEDTVTGKVLTATTAMVKEFRLRQPSDFLQLQFTTSLVSALPNGTPQPVDVTFESAENGKVYDVALRFHYREWEGAVIGPGELKYLEYLFAQNVLAAATSGSTAPVSAKYVGQELLSLLGNSLSKNPNITREPLELPIEYIYYSGAEPFYDLLRSSQGQSGITALEATPIFTNIDGGYGLFSSRYSKNRPEVGITDDSKDSLACGRFTRELNFRVDINTSCQ